MELNDQLEYLKILEEKDEFGDSIIHFFQEIPETINFLSKHKFDFNSQNIYGDTLLHSLVLENDFNLVQSFFNDHPQVYFDFEIKNDNGNNIFEVLDILERQSGENVDSIQKIRKFLLEKK